MSNPGVIMLSECTTLKGESFRVEDNIGESIHIHHGDFRLDFTIKEFIEFSEMIEESLSSLIDVEGFNLSELDPVFLDAIGEGVLDIESVTKDRIRLSDLEVYTGGLKGFGVGGISDSRMYKALVGEAGSYEKYQQSNHYGQTNQARLNGVLRETEKKGYPVNNRYIVLFNDQNIIRDGQHRASALYYLKGDIDIDVVRIKFRNNKFNISRYPAFYLVISKLGHFPKKSVVMLYWKLRRLAGKTLRALNMR